MVKEDIDKLQQIKTLLVATFMQSSNLGQI